MTEVLSGQLETALSTAEIEALSKVRWAHEEPHPDGGTRAIFGLLRIVIPKPAGIEYIEMGEVDPKKIFIPRDSRATIPSPLDARNSQLVYRNLRISDPIRVYLASSQNVIEPINPQRINEIGDLIIDTDTVLMQDRQSRIVLETQQRLLEMYNEFVQKGVVDKDDEVMKQLIEGASVHLKLLADTRKELSKKIRALTPRAEQLGVIFIDQSLPRNLGLQLDPRTIPTIYTPDTDHLTLSEFQKHTLRINRSLKPPDYYS